MIGDRRSGARFATSSAGTDVVGIVPDEASSLGPSASLRLESNDERALQCRDMARETRAELGGHASVRPPDVTASSAAPRCRDRLWR